MTVVHPFFPALTARQALARLGAPAGPFSDDPLLRLPRAVRPDPFAVPAMGAIPLVSHAGVRRARWGGMKGLTKLAASLGDRVGPVSLVPTAGFRAQLLSLAASRPPAIAVLGGDGTARTALEVLTPLGIPVVPLPGGTLNRLSRLVYGSGSARAILRRVAAAGQPRPLAGAHLGPHRFFVACGFGNAMGLHSVREALRRGAPMNALGAFQQAARGLFSPRVMLADPAGASCAVDQPVQMAVVAVGPIAAAFGIRAPEQPAPGQGGLEAVTTRANSWWQLAQLAPHALAGSWPELPTVTRTACNQVRFVVTGGSEPVAGLLDGEPILLDGEAVILFDPACGLVMAA